MLLFKRNRVHLIFVLIYILGDFASVGYSRPIIAEYLHRTTRQKVQPEEEKEGVIKKSLIKRGGASSASPSPSTVSSSSTPPSSIPSPSSDEKEQCETDEAGVGLESSKSKSNINSNSNSGNRDENEKKQNKNATFSNHIDDDRTQLHSNHSVVVRKNIAPPVTIPSSSSSSSKLLQKLQPSKQQLHANTNNKHNKNITLRPHMISVYSVQGKRAYMEDEYFTNQDGSFVAIFDGHGGKAVSRYLRQNLYARFLQARATTPVIPPIILSEQKETDDEGEHGKEDESGVGSEHDDADLLQINNKTDNEQEQKGHRPTTVTDMKKILNTSLTSKKSFNSWKARACTPEGFEEVVTASTSASSILAVQSSIQALTSAFGKIDAEVSRISHWSFQGSTAVAVLLCEVQEQQHQQCDSSLSDDTGKDEQDKKDGIVTRSTEYENKNRTILISANVGDSRAVLSHSGRAIDLTRDHKPNDPIERKRIEELGGEVKWCGPINPKTGKPVVLKNSTSSKDKNKIKSKKHGNSLSTTRRGVAGVYRINGNLALSRAIGDRSEKPLVSSEVDIQQIELDKERDEFIILASDGLWNVMSSQEVVDYCHNILGNTIKSDTEGTTSNINWVKKAMAQQLVTEALKRGSMDNISVVVIWFW